MKKIIVMLSVFLVVAFIFPVNTFADMGPKPSVVLNFKGLDNEIYYVTLLSKEENNGPFSANEELSPDDYRIINDKDYGAKAYDAFRNYNDKDGFYFINVFERCNDENTFVWGYYPPQTFKVLLYFPQNDTFVISDVYERYAFDSYFEVTTEMNQGIVNLTVQNSYDYKREIFSLIARIIATIFIEIIIALFFGLKNRKILLCIILTNIFTQVTLNILLNLINYYYGILTFYIFFAFMEIFVFAIEAVTYTNYFKISKSISVKLWIAPVYALVANIASFIAGIILAIVIPGMF